MKIENGMMFYDERNDRYLKVWSVRPRSKVVQCDVLERDEDGYYDLSQVGLFTFNELVNFKEVKG